MKVKLTEKQMLKVLEEAGYQHSKDVTGKMDRFTDVYTGKVVSFVGIQKAFAWIKKSIECNPGYYFRAEDMLNTLIGDQLHYAKLVDPNTGV